MANWHTHAWGEEKEQRLRELWNAGKTGGQIADLLGVSRCAVLGKVRRMDLPRREPAGRCTGKPRRHRTTVRKSVMFSARVKREKKWVVPDPMWPMTRPAGKSILDIKDGQCRYPVAGEGIDVILCSAKCHDKSVYCSTHYVQAYMPPKAR